MAATEVGLQQGCATTTAKQSPVRKSRACVSCHERKVRCNAGQVGLPCSRCVNRKESDTCVLVPIPEKDKNSTKRKRNEISPQHSVRREAPGRSGQPTIPPSPLSSNNNHESEQNPPSALLDIQAFDAAMIGNSLSGRAFTGISVYGHTPRVEDTGEAARSVPVESTQQITQFDASVPEEDSELQICREMFQQRPNATSPTRAGLLNQDREVIEYHNGTNTITILGDVFAQDNPRRLVRILLRDAHSASGKTREMAALDKADREYLQTKGAFDLPPHEACNKFLRLYFQCVYPYAPILNRIEFMQDYSSGNYSSFIIQCILANVVPYASQELLLEAGFSDRLAAQKSFFEKAKLLCDLGSGIGQLQVLQGSLMLSSIHFSFGLDKDYRFWLTNAVRIATQMGLHRNSIANDLDPGTRRLFRRIWWVIYSRDALLAVSGLDNVRRLHDRDCDTAELTELDWGEEEETIPEPFKEILLPTTLLHKMYFIENCKLARISVKFVQVFKRPGLAPSDAAAQEIGTDISSWRRSLPAEILTERVQEWSAGNVWVLVLAAMGYRLECILYRAISEKYRGGTNDGSFAQKARLKQQNAVFELGIIIDRIARHDVASFCPLSVTICASTIVALHIEIALNPGSNQSERLTAKTHIHRNMTYLKDACDRWSTMKSTVRMFEFIIDRTKLSLDCFKEPQFDARSMNLFNPIETPNSAFTPEANDMVDINMNDGSYAFGTILGKHPEEWMQDLFGPSMQNFYSDPSIHVSL